MSYNNIKSKTVNVAEVRKAAVIGFYVSCLSLLAFWCPPIGIIGGLFGVISSKSVSKQMGLFANDRSITRLWKSTYLIGFTGLFLSLIWTLYYSIWKNHEALFGFFGTVFGWIKNLFV